MFEKEIKFISDFCLNKVKGLGSFFTYEKLAGTDLHPAILRYVSAEIDYMIFADRKKLLQNSYFDYSGKEIFQRFNEISGEIKKTKKISFDDVKKLIIQAVSFNANYVVRPKWSLSKLIYHELKYVSVDELEVMLKYIYYYDYLKNVLAAYLTKRKIVQLSATEFDLILNKIDRELFKSNSDQLIYNSLKSIGDFFNIGGLDKTKVSPIAVEILLKEKNLVNFLLKLRREIPTEGAKKEYDIDEIQKILLSSVPSDTEDDENLDDEKVETSEAEIGVEESATDEKDDEKNMQKTLGEMADDHAAELEKADLNEILNSEEERLVEMYERELKELDEQILDETLEDVKAEEEIFQEEVKDNIDDSTNTNEKIETVTGKVEEQTDEQISEKEIVSEMLDDYFGDQPETILKEDLITKNIEASNGDIKDFDPLKNGMIDENVEDSYSSNKLDSLEDELLEVFEDLDEMKIEIPQFEKLDESTIEEKSIKEELSEENITTEIIAEEDIYNENRIKEIEQSEIEAELVDGDAIINDDEVTGEIIEEISGESEDEVENLKEVYEEEKDEFLNEVEPEKELIRRKNDLFSYLKRKEIKKIITSIFGGDEMDFVTTIEKISECSTYKEGTEILKGVFFSYKISPFSKEAVMFTNAVSNYFRQV